MVISQTREKQASSLTEITWKGKTVPVKNEQVRSFILHSNDSKQEVERAESFENKMAVYDQLLMECKDGLQSLKDEIKPDQVSLASWQDEIYCMICVWDWSFFYGGGNFLQSKVSCCLHMYFLWRHHLPPGKSENCQDMIDLAMYCIDI
jgi:hypothetical protein